MAKTAKFLVCEIEPDGSRGDALGMVQVSGFDDVHNEAMRRWKKKPDQISIVTEDMFDTVRTTCSRSHVKTKALLTAEAGN